MTNSVDKPTIESTQYPKGFRFGAGDDIIVSSQVLEAYVAQKEREAYDNGFDAGREWTEPSIQAAVEFRQEQYGWNDTKMAYMLNMSKSHFSEFKHGKRGLPINSIRKAYAIGIPASVLLAELQPKQGDKE